MNRLIRTFLMLLIAHVMAVSVSFAQVELPTYMRSSIFPVLVKSDKQNQRISREIDSIAEASDIKIAQILSGTEIKRQLNDTSSVSLAELPQIMFLKLDVPENFNSHMLSDELRVVDYDSIRSGIEIDPEEDSFRNAAKKKIGAKISADGSGESVWLRSEDVDKAIVDVMNVYFDQGMVAPKLVAKWYDYNDVVVCDSDSIIPQRWDLETLRYRFTQNMSAEEVEKAENNPNYRTILEQKAEDMLGQTYVVAVNLRFRSNKALIREIENAANKSKEIMDQINKLSQVGGLLSTIKVIPGGQIFGALGMLSGISSKALGPVASNLSGTLAHALAGDGFSVEAFTTLFVLDWDKEHAEKFYTEIFDNNATLQDLYDMGLCTLTPVSQKKSYCWVRQGKFSSKPISDLVLRATARAYDSALADLQEGFEPFRVISPITSCDGKGNVFAKIGMKENIQEGDVYEVLEMNEDENGHITFKPICEVKAEKDKIWNNRFQADIEAQENEEFMNDPKNKKIEIPGFNKKDDAAVALGHTTFSGKDKKQDYTGYYLRLKDKKKKK